MTMWKAEALNIYVQISLGGVPFSCTAYLFGCGRTGSDLSGDIFVQLDSFH